MQEVVGFTLCLLGVIAALWAVIKWELSSPRTVSLQSWVAPIGTGGLVAICLGLSIAFMVEGSSQTFDAVRWVLIGGIITITYVGLVFWHFLIRTGRV